MELKDFIGKVVISTKTKQRFYLHRITAPDIGTVTVAPDSFGHHTFYRWDTINGDPFSNGNLIFEDATLLEPFKKVYDAYCRTEDAYWENYGYWMRKD